MSDRRLVIPVGTSLSASASWRNQGRLLEVHGYGEWLTPGYLEDPKRRRTRGWSVAEELAELLVKCPPAELARFFEWHPDHPRRYSAELTTLARLYENHREAQEDFAGFLGRYQSIDLVAPGSRTDPARIAANHLQQILGGTFRHPRCEVKEVLVSRFLTQRIERLARFLEELRGQRVDLLVSGAYKAYTLVAGLMAAGNPGTWRLIYLHEEQEGQLIVGEADAHGRWVQSTSTGSAAFHFATPTAVEGL